MCASCKDAYACHGYCNKHISTSRPIPHILGQALFLFKALTRYNKSNSFKTKQTMAYTYMKTTTTTSREKQVNKAAYKTLNNRLPNTHIHIYMDIKYTWQIYINITSVYWT